MTRTIPITPTKLTGDVLEACYRQYLNGTDLADWAHALLVAGFESNAIVDAMVSNDLHWQKVVPLFSSMCREVGLSVDVVAEVATLRQEVMIEEFKFGQRKAAELLHRFEDLRKRIGFPEGIDLRLLEDNDDATNDSGYYGSRSRECGAELETRIRSYLTRAGIGV